MSETFLAVLFMATGLAGIGIGLGSLLGVARPYRSQFARRWFTLPWGRPASEGRNRGKEVAYAAAICLMSTSVFLSGLERRFSLESDALDTLQLGLLLLGLGCTLLARRPRTRA